MSLHIDHQASRIVIDLSHEMDIDGDGQNDDITFWVPTTENQGDDVKVDVFVNSTTNRFEGERAYYRTQKELTAFTDADSVTWSVADVKVEEARLKLMSRDANGRIIERSYSISQLILPPRPRQVPGFCNDLWWDCYEELFKMPLHEMLPRSYFSVMA